MCSGAKLEIGEDHKIKRTGEPTEAALKVLVEKLGCPDQALNDKALQTGERMHAETFCDYWSSNFTNIAILEFTRDRKSMSVVVRRVRKQSPLL